MPYETWRFVNASPMPPSYAAYYEKHPEHVDGPHNHWKEQATICITKGDPEWDEAYANWIKGKNPTDSKEWKKGVVVLSRSLK